MAYLGLHEDPAGVAGDKGHEDQFGRPLRGILQADGAAGGGHDPERDRQGQVGGDGQAQREPEAPGEAGGHHRRNHGEDEG